MSFARKVKSCANKLQADYENGFINYPRIDNGYISESEIFEFFPHKPFDNSFSKEYNAIKSKTLPLNKRNSLLFLNNERLISPSQAVNYAKLIDDYLDDDLNFKDKQKQEEFQKIFEVLRNFLKDKFETNDLEEQEKIVKSKQQSFYLQPSNMLFYKVPKYCFIKNLSSTLKAKRRSPQEILDFYYEKLKAEEKARIKKEEYYRRKEYLKECFENFLLEIAKIKDQMKQTKLIQNKNDKDWANYLNTLE